MRAGITTIRFRLLDMELDPDTLLAKGWKEQGEVLRGRRWYFTWLERCIQVRYNPPDVLVKVSLPRFLYGDVQTIVTLSSLPMVYDQLNHLLSEELDQPVRVREEALPTRTDFAFDVAVPDPQRYIRAAWVLMAIPRTRRIRYPSQLTLLWYNKSRSVKLTDRSRDVPAEQVEKKLRLEVTVRGRERLARYLVPMEQPHREFVIRQRAEELRLRDIETALWRVGQDAIDFLTAFRLVPRAEFEERLIPLCQAQGVQFKKMRDRLTEIAEKGWESLENRLPQPTFYRFRRQARSIGLLPGEEAVNFDFFREGLNQAMWETV